MASIKGRPPTKGSFKKGPDPRRNANGQINALQIEFGKKIRMALVAEGQQPSKKRKGLTRFESMIFSVWDEAEQGVPWAVEYVSERTEGKITQPIGEDPNMPFANKITIFQYGSAPEPSFDLDVNASTNELEQITANSPNGHNGT